MYSNLHSYFHIICLHECISPGRETPHPWHYEAILGTFDQKRYNKNPECNDENRRVTLICFPNSYLNTRINGIVHGTIIIAECCMTAWPQCIGCQPGLDSSMLGSPAPISQNYGTINQQNDNYDTQHFYF